MARSTRLMTAEELLVMQPEHLRSELVDGRMYVREPASYRHGEVAALLLGAIMAHVQREKCGRVLAAETGFTLRRNPDTVRAPDVAYVSNARRPAPGVRGYAELAPDLAVEVLSPSGRAGKVRSKIDSWLSAGTLLVWVVDPERHLARMYASSGEVTVLGIGDFLDGGAVLPGLRVSLDEVLA